MCDAEFRDLLSCSEENIYVRCQITNKIIPLRIFSLFCCVMHHRTRKAEYDVEIYPEHKNI
jgi:hypothetical protein